MGELDINERAGNQRDMNEQGMTEQSMTEQSMTEQGMNPNKGSKWIPALKIGAAALMGWMSYIVISTSLKSSLFQEWHSLGSIPWMRATLWDFYANTLVIYLWVCYKERTLAQRIIWLILLVTLGSIATCAYLFIQLFKLKPGEGLKELFTARS